MGVGQRREGDSSSEDEDQITPAVPSRNHVKQAKSISEIHNANVQRHQLEDDYMAPSSVGRSSVGTESLYEDLPEARFASRTQTLDSDGAYVAITHKRISEQHTGALPPTPTAPQAPDGYHGRDQKYALYSIHAKAGGHLPPPLPGSARPQLPAERGRNAPGDRAEGSGGSSYDIDFGGLAVFDKDILLPPAYDDLFPTESEISEQARREARSYTLVKENIPKSQSECALKGARRKREGFEPIYDDGNNPTAGMYTPLPPGWARSFHKTTGQPFFVDHNTFATQCEDPRPLPEFWEQRVTEKGHAYFIDHLGRKSFWEHPCATDLPSGWQQLYDSNDALYYVDTRAENPKATRSKPMRHGKVMLNQNPDTLDANYGSIDDAQNVNAGAGLHSANSTDYGKQIGLDHGSNIPFPEAAPAARRPGRQNTDASSVSSNSTFKRENTLMSDGTAGKKHCFLSHNWGKDIQGRMNEDRVRLINELLKAKGYQTWCDFDQLQGGSNLDAAMADGIENSDCIFVFLTQTYLDKVKRADPNDNCFKEFQYATMKRAGFIMPIVMEPQLRSPKDWSGAVALHLSGKIYVDMSADDVETNMEHLTISMENFLSAARIEDFDKGVARTSQTSFMAHNPPMGGARQVGGGGSFRSTQDTYDTRTMSDIEFDQHGVTTPYGIPSNSNSSMYDRVDRTQSRTTNSTYDHLHIRHDMGEASHAQHNSTLQHATVTQQPQAMGGQSTYAIASHHHNIPSTKHTENQPYLASPSPDDLYAAFDGDLEKMPTIRKLDDQGRAKRPTISSEDARSIRQIAKDAVAHVDAEARQMQASRVGAAPVHARGATGPRNNPYEAPDPHAGISIHRPAGGGDGGQYGGLYDRPEGHRGYEVANLHKDYEVADPHHDHTDSVSRPRRMSGVATDMPVYEPIPAQETMERTSKSLARWSGSKRGGAPPPRRGQQAGNGGGGGRRPPPGRGQQQRVVTQQPSAQHAPLRQYTSSAHSAPYEPVGTGGPVPQPRPQPRQPRQYAVNHDAQEETDI